MWPAGSRRSRRDANQLFLAFQIGELTKRVDRIDEKLLSRTQVGAIVLVTLAAVIGAAAATFAILKALGFVH